MARTIEEIKADMTSAFMNDAAAQEAYGFASGTKFSSQFSSASIESILFYVFAVCAYAVERLTEAHLADVTAKLATLKPHTLSWYQAKALAFRFGESVNDETGDYDTDATSSTIMPVAQCAVNEADGGGLVIKLATNGDDGLEPLSSQMTSAFKAYINRIKDAGVKITTLTQKGDRLTLNLIVYVDGTVFYDDDAENPGMLIASPTFPVQTAIQEYLTKLPFNGELVLEHLTDYLQNVSGVEVPHIVSATAAAVGQSSNLADTSGYADPTSISVRATPASGYFVVSFDPEDSWASSISYLVKE